MHVELHPTYATSEPGKRAGELISACVHCGLQLLQFKSAIALVRRCADICVYFGGKAFTYCTGRE